MTQKLIQSNELSRLHKSASLAKKNIGLCHGVFDILHVGHKRYFEAAKKRVDILVVSVTAAQFVGKGPGRPIFNNDLRCEMIASLECVDFVVISNESSSVNIISELKPNFYFKGMEYQDQTNDLSGKIIQEKKAVQQHGGETVFINEITFSSSKIANQLMPTIPKAAATFIQEIREKLSLDSIRDTFKRVKSKKILVIGETIIDEYSYVAPLGKPSKENIIATRYLESQTFTGGVVPIANQLANFSAKTTLCTLVGQQDYQQGITKQQVSSEIVYVPMYWDNGITTRKQRLVDPDYTRKLFEIYYIDDGAPPKKFQTQFRQWLADNLHKFDIVIVNDFGHGMIDFETAKLISSSTASLALNVQTNSGNRGFNLVTKYPKANFVCIDLPEARLATKMQFQDPIEVALSLLEILGCEALIITNGKHGAVGVKNGQAPINFPALTDNAIDTMGAGDAFFSLASLIFLEECNVLKAGFVGNALASLQVTHIGQDTRTDFALLDKYIKILLDA